MSKHKKILAICSTVNYIKAVTTKEKCAECNIDLFLSESTLNAVRQDYPAATKEDLHIVCMGCSLEIIKNADEVTTKPITKEQEEEISKYISGNIKSTTKEQEDQINNYISKNITNNYKN